MQAPSAPQRIGAQRRDFMNYRVLCPRCGGAIGPRSVTREFLDVPPDPPYAAVARCPKCGHELYVEFLQAP